MLLKKSLLSFDIFSLSNKNSMPSVKPICINTRRKTHIFDKVALSTNNSSFLVPERVIRAASIDRTYGHQIFNGTRRPSRDKAAHSPRTFRSKKRFLYFRPPHWETRPAVEKFAAPPTTPTTGRPWTNLTASSF